MSLSLSGIIPFSLCWCIHMQIHIYIHIHIHTFTGPTRATVFSFCVPMLLLFFPSLFSFLFFIGVFELSAID